MVENSLNEKKIKYAFKKVKEDIFLLSKDVYKIKDNVENIAINSNSVNSGTVNPIRFEKFIKAVENEIKTLKTSFNTLEKNQSMNLNNDKIPLFVNDFERNQDLIVGRLSEFADVIENIKNKINKIPHLNNIISKAEFEKFVTTFDEQIWSINNSMEINEGEVKSLGFAFEKLSDIVDDLKNNFENNNSNTTNNINSSNNRIKNKSTKDICSSTKVVIEKKLNLINKELENTKKEEKSNLETLNKRIESLSKDFNKKYKTLINNDNNNNSDSNVKNDAFDFNVIENDLDDFKKTFEDQVTNFENQQKSNEENIESLKQDVEILKVNINTIDTDNQKEISKIKEDINSLKKKSKNKVSQTQLKDNQLNEIMEGLSEKGTLELSNLKLEFTDEIAKIYDKFFAEILDLKSDFQETKKMFSEDIINMIDKNQKKSNKGNNVESISDESLKLNENNEVIIEPQEEKTSRLKKIARWLFIDEEEEEQQQSEIDEIQSIKEEANQQENITKNKK